MIPTAWDIDISFQQLLKYKHFNEVSFPTIQAPNTIGWI